MSQSNYDIFIKDEGRCKAVMFKTLKAKEFAVKHQIPNGLESYKETGFCGDAVFDAEKAPEGVYELHCRKGDAKKIERFAMQAGLVIENF